MALQLHHAVTNRSLTVYKIIIKKPTAKVMKEISRADFLALGGWSLAGIIFLPLTSFTNYINMEEHKNFDVIIIGGSYAGLSAAMVLGRSLRNILVIDNGKPCNRYTPHAHNFITHDGEIPSAISFEAKNEVKKYGTVAFLEDLAVSGKKGETGFEIIVQSGQRLKASKLILATGIRDIIPSIDGFEECWGKTIIHCPYCHGYEFKGEKTAILANGDQAFHLATLVNNLTEHLTIITSNKASFNKMQKEKLARNNVSVIEKSIGRILHHEGQLNAIAFQDGSRSEFSAMYAALPFEQHSNIPSSLGCDSTESGHIKIDMFQKTSVEGVFACGDNTAMMRSIANAVAAGNLAGAMANKELTDEQF